jgi:CO/xanthine dehydrogenase FAD-binding subunit
MSELRYLRPETLAQALEALSRYGSAARVLNGGTDLMVRLQRAQISPDVIVDIKGVSDIGDSPEWESDRVTIGARVVMTKLVRDTAFRNEFPALVDAAATVGSVQIRNRATVAGNICNASPAADTVPPLLVYKATVLIAGPEGIREIPLQEFFLGPGKTVRRPEELLVAIQIPRRSDAFGSAFGRLTRRHGVDLASINMAFGIDSRGVVDAAFGAVGPTPIAVRDTSGRFGDPNLQDGERDQLLQALFEQTSPITDVRASAEYRLAMLMVVGRRVLAGATQRYIRAREGK